jgi:hypothetical protein
LGQPDTFLAAGRLGGADLGPPRPGGRRGWHSGVSSGKGAESAQKLGHLQPFIAVFPQECMEQLAYMYVFVANLTPFSFQRYANAVLRPLVGLALGVKVILVPLCIFHL